MQYFNKSNSEVEYIKNLMRVNYIPKVRFFNTNMNMQPSPTTSDVWVDDGDINQATMWARDIQPIAKTATHPDVSGFVGESVIINNNFYKGIAQTEGDIGTEKFDYISSYIFGNWYKNLTTNYQSNKSYYDSGLHEYLGRYLRAYRDYYMIDVMNFYNCFSNRFITTYSLPFVDFSAELTAHDENYNLTAFPICYDTTYRVQFSCGTSGDVTVQAIYFNGTVPLNGAELTSVGGEVVAKTYTLNSPSSFYARIGSSANSDQERRTKLSKEWLLYLFIQYPASTEGHITVMEQPKFTFAINNEILNLNQYTTMQVAFSDTLLEYLTGAVISPAQYVDASIANVQQKLIKQGFFDKFGVGGPNYAGVEIPNYKFKSGIFDEGMHQIIYKAFYDYDTLTKRKISNLPSIELSSEEFGDISLLPNFIGYVDKNVEGVLNALKL